MERSIREWQWKLFEQAQSKGLLHDLPPANQPTARLRWLQGWVAHAHSELSEAFEAIRDDRLQLSFVLDEHDNPRPVGMPSELADIIKAIAVIAGVCDVDLNHALEEKFAYDAGRAERHGRRV